MTGTDSSIAQNAPVRTANPSALLNTPRLMATLWVAG